jgi:hypothetical protein
MIRLVASTVPIAKVSIDAPPAQDMIEVVGTGERGPLGDAELGFDGVEPGGVSRRPHGTDVEAAKQGHETRVIMNISRLSMMTKRRLRG